jgi:hypothetical protein
MFPETSNNQHCQLIDILAHSAVEHTACQAGHLADCGPLHCYWPGAFGSIMLHCSREQLAAYHCKPNHHASTCTDECDAVPCVQIRLNRFVNPCPKHCAEDHGMAASIKQYPPPASAYCSAGCLSYCRRSAQDGAHAGSLTPSFAEDLETDTDSVSREGSYHAAMGRKAACSWRDVRTNQQPDTNAESNKPLV